MSIQKSHEACKVNLHGKSTSFRSIAAQKDRILLHEDGVAALIRSAKWLAAWCIVREMEQDEIDHCTKVSKC